MEATKKTHTAFRLDNQLITRLKKAAKKEHRSLNNYVENVLYNVVNSLPQYCPNKETIEAIEEAQSGVLSNNKEIDTSNIEAFFKSIEE